MARIIYAHIIRTVYAGIKVGREDRFFQSILRGSGTFFGHLQLSVYPHSAFRTMVEGFVENCQKCYRRILLL